MARKKSISRANKAATCSECGGIRFGAGYKHAAGCSKAFVRNAPKAGGKRRKKRRGLMGGRVSVAALTGGGGVGNGGKIDLRVLRGMGAEQLLDLKHRVDTLLKSKVGEIKEKMSMFERMLLSISGK